jgi:AcrB/AcrD/AcrF family
MRKGLEWAAALLAWPACVAAQTQKMPPLPPPSAPAASSIPTTLRTEDALRALGIRDPETHRKLFIAPTFIVQVAFDVAVTYISFFSLFFPRTGTTTWARPSERGLLPAAISTGVGSDTQKPFAIVVVAGLSRLLLGFFVNPVMYEVVAREGDVLQV